MAIESMKIKFTNTLNSVGVVLGWATGLCLALAVAIMLVKNHNSWPGALSLLMALTLVTPPVRRKFLIYTKGSPSPAQTIVLVFLLMLAAPLINDSAEWAFQQAKVHAAVTQDFQAHKPALIETMRVASDAESLEKSIAAANQYSAVSDRELKDQINDSRQKLDRLNAVAAAAALQDDFTKNSAVYRTQIGKLMQQKKYKDASALAHKYDQVSDAEFKLLAEKADGRVKMQDEYNDFVEKQDSEDAQYTLKAAAESALKEILKDPDSAQFRNEQYHRSGNVRVVCGEVNAKNGFGGFTGYKHFLSMGIAQATFIEDQSNNFANAWNKFCR